MHKHMHTPSWRHSHQDHQDTLVTLGASGVLSRIINTVLMLGLHDLPLTSLDILLFLFFAPVKESFSFLLKPTAPDDSAFRCCSVRLSIDFSPSRQPLSKAALINTFTMEQMRATHIIELCTQLIYLSG